jgi:predicted O-methyltransferase YrrM
MAHLATKNPYALRLGRPALTLVGFVFMLADPPAQPSRQGGQIFAATGSTAPPVPACRRRLPPDAKKAMNPMELRSVPWMTDGSVGFLTGFIERFRRVTGSAPAILEFGVGASTLFFAQRASSLVSFEHDESWHGAISRIVELQGNNNARLQLLPRPYSERVTELVGAERFDIVSIDGRDRVACLREVLGSNLLRRDGIIVFDNTERITGYNGRYAEAFDLLRDAYTMIHFEQIGRDRTGWQAPHRWLTTVAWRRSEQQYTTVGATL